MAIEINLNNVQEKLVIGTNIKTVNGETLLGSGNLETSPLLDIKSNYILSKQTTNSIQTPSQDIILSVNTAQPNKILGTSGLRGIWAGYDNTINANIASNIFGSHHSGIEGSTSNHSTIIGGSYSTIKSGAYTSIIGGTQNTIEGASDNGSTIVGGFSNKVTNSAAVVIGGTNNSSSGNSSTVIGGANNSSSGNSSSVISGTNNNSSGVGSTISGGINNEVEGNYSSISSGYACKILSSHSFLGGGRDNEIKLGADFATILGGRGNTIEATSLYSRVSGIDAIASVRGGDYISNGMIDQKGDAQTFIVPIRIKTTNSSLKPIRPNDFFKLEIPNDKVWTFKALIVASDGVDVASFEVKGCASKLSSNVTIVGTPTISSLGNTSGASLWDITVTGVTTELRINAKGEELKDIKWSGRVEVAETGLFN